MAVHVVERCFYNCQCGIGPWKNTHPRFGMTRETPARRAESNARRPVAFRRRLLWSSRTPLACCSQLSIHFPEDRARCRDAAHHRSTSAAFQRATWNWQHRDDARDGESGGEDVHCDGDKHASRAAVPNHRHSSFCYTCCPGAASLAPKAPLSTVERSDERLN